jgi:glutamate-1-semialdehyde 2,1-aminomutase
VLPDLVTLAKSIGGGFPLGAFGGRAEYMNLITDNKVLHLGTYNGNPLVMAAATATLTEACSAEATDAAISRNERLTAACAAVIADFDLPAHTVLFGAKGCITWRRERVRNYRDWKSAVGELAFAQWIHGINRGILLPPGLDEQWLISVMHDEDDTMRYAQVFAEFATELTG